jgi:hypothetical protein
LERQPGLMLSSLITWNILKTDNDIFFFTFFLVENTHICIQNTRIRTFQTVPFSTVHLIHTQARMNRHTATNRIISITSVNQQMPF